MFKVGDMVKPFRWLGEWKVVFIAENDPTPYLCVSSRNGQYTTSWFSNSELQKFKINEVWETRDGGKRVTIVSVCDDHKVRYPIIGIFNANTSVASASGFTFDGHYEYDVKEDPQDLVKKIS